MAPEPFSTPEALRFGWDTFKRNVGVSLGLGAASLGALLLLSGASQAAQRYAALSLGLTIVTQVVQAFIGFVWIRFALAIHDARGIVASDLVPRLAWFLEYLGVWILYGLLVSAGLILLVIPGIYLAVRYGLAPLVVADRRADVMRAFRESSELTRGARWRLLLLGLVLFVMNLVGAIPFGLGLLVTLPVSVFAAVMVYRRLAGRTAYDQALVSPPWPIATMDSASSR